MPPTVNPAFLATEISPVPQAASWAAEVTFPTDRPLINVSQAAPVAPPPRGLREAMSTAILNDTSAHLYGGVLGMPALRDALARRTSAHYGADVRPDQVAITSGCNQAFAAAIATLAGSGDEVLLPTPWYFNHKMWLDMNGIRAVPVPTDTHMIPHPDTARRLLTDRTRAIVLVTPNNPTGVEYPADTIAAFAAFAREHDLALIIDETYRDFHTLDGPPHDLFEAPDWDDTIIHLYSFSKAYRLTGHRVGALLSSPERLREVEKFIDTVTICPSQVGQIGALWGLQNLDEWLAGERDEILDRRAAIIEGFAPLAERDWTLKGCGAYFAYLEHPFDETSEALARRMVQQAGLLCLPGTMFEPKISDAGARHLRIAFANVDRTGIAQLFKRLRSLPGPT